MELLIKREVVMVSFLGRLKLQFCCFCQQLPRWGNIVYLGEETKVYGTFCKFYSVINMILELLKEDRLFFASRLCRKVECRSSSFMYVPKSVRHFCGLITLVAALLFLIDEYTVINME